jgi:hypothetical protein
MDVIARLQAAAADVFADQPVQFAYLFGSHARGEARADSDVDVAVHFTADVDPERYLALSTSLSGLLAHRASVGPINGIVVLNEAPLRLAGRILRDRVIIYRSDEPARVAYEVRTGKQAMDFEIHAAPLDRALLATMAKDE